MMMMMIAGAAKAGAKAKELHMRRSLRTVRMVWVILLLVDNLLLMLIGVAPSSDIGVKAAGGGGAAPSPALALPERLHSSLPRRIRLHCRSGGRPPACQEAPYR